MLLLAFFTPLSALLIAAAPLPMYHRISAENHDSQRTLYRRAPPKFEIPTHFVPKSRRKETLDKMMEHYETKATDEQKGAGLAGVTTRWNKLFPGRQYMNFNYHVGGTTKSPIIPPTAEIYSDKPVPKILFENVIKEHRADMKAEGLKQYNDLHYSQVLRVKSMKVSDDWDLDGGIREKTKLTFHSSVIPNANNIVGDPMTIRRPLTLQLPDDISSLDKMTISRDIREAHKKMAADKDHPASTSNYGTVHSGWHNSSPDANGRTHEQVVVGLEEVSEDEEQRKHLGNYAIRRRKRTSGRESPGLNAGSSLSHSGTSHAGQSHLDIEVPRPSNSQEQQYLIVGSPPTHGLPSNIGSSRPVSQGSSQFNASSPLSRPGPSHSEILQTVSAHQPLEFPTDNPPQHDAFYMPSPELWRPWNPESQASHDTWQSLHPDLYSDQLWRESPRPKSIPPNSQIQSHPSSPSSQFRAGSSPGPSSHHGTSHLESLHPVSPPVQFHSDSTPWPNEFYIPSPELWRPWDPASQLSDDTWQSLHPDLYSDQLWRAESPRPKSPPPNSQILHYLNSPSSHPGLSHSEPAQSSGAVKSSQQPPQIGPSSDSGGSPHAK